MQYSHNHCKWLWRKEYSQAFRVAPMARTADVFPGRNRVLLRVSSQDDWQGCDVVHILQDPLPQIQKSHSQNDWVSKIMDKTWSWETPVFLLLSSLESLFWSLCNIVWSNSNLKPCMFCDQGQHNQGYEECVGYLCYVCLGSTFLQGPPGKTKH